ncbi:uncharacterized protein PRCAT00003825001 [Priceomyces carsonii]|uniref:uncharacterized protein n=1 Tax=Priceomyces carsonii TaxID=28549 RepID=UPI002EDA89F1|nr:unnamed protein product [Priceomyces carsonii]
MSDLSIQKKLEYEEDDSNSLNEFKVSDREADATLSFMEENKELFHNIEFTEEESTSLDRKLKYILFPLIFTINTILFIDKATLSYASILGLFTSTNINSKQYDDLNSIFYAGYTVGQLLNYVLQKTSLKWFMTGTLFTWSVIVFAHCGADNFGGLVILRLLLGITESIITPALEITMLQFFTPQQRATLQPVFWCSCVGTSVIIAGFIAYGVLHTNVIPPWKIFMIITGGLTLIITAISAYLYPADPSKANFLTKKERYYLIKRIQNSSRASITQHVVKKEQLIECIKDPISWLFTLFSFLLMLANNLNYQQNLLYVSLGVDELGSTLVSVAGGGFSAAFHIAGAIFIHYFPNKSAWVILGACIPSIASGIAMLTIPWDKKISLLAMLVLGANTYGLAYIVALGWSTSSASGTTKRFFRHFMFMFAYGVSNIISPQLWTGKQSNASQPRYHAAWIVQIVLAWTGSSVVAFVISFILQKRNKERLQLISSNEKSDVGIVVKHDSENNEEIYEQVNIANLDLTDLENKTFIYPL